MENTRWMGRSGPRKKTGCFTCRRRKVRCDETKPVCAHCTRLRLNCQYNKPTSIASDRYPESNISYNTTDNRRTSPSVAAITSTAASDGSCATPHSALPIDFNPDDMLNAILQQADQQSTSGNLQPQLSASTSNIGGQYDTGLSTSFDISQFIGGITNELQQKQQGIQENIDAQVPMFPAASDGSGRDLQQNHLAELMNDDVLGNSSSPMSAASSVRGHQERNRSMEPSSTWKALSEEQLLQHFLSIDSPPVLVAPLEAEWKFVRPAVLAMARDFNPLMNAIFCFSAVHKSRIEGSSYHWASSYYRDASNGVSQYTTDDINSEDLRRIFATIFFLMMVELLSSPSDWNQPANSSYLRVAYLILNRYRHRISSWRGFGRLLVSWISLLDVKSVIAGRDGDLLVDLGELSEPMDGTICESIGGDEALSNHPTFLIYEAVVGPAFRFFVKSQQICRRIVHIDLHHRTRGTLSDEYEVLQIAHKVGEDLESLWNNRPAVLDVYDRPGDLYGTLTQPIIRQICRTFRQYIANFLAHFIYLHRVAFAIYPRTDRVNSAVDKILQLARVDINDGHLSDSFLWPLLIAGLEASASQRRWIITEMSHMVDVTPNQPTNDNPNGENNSVGATFNPERHPNAEKALRLLEEVTRRQDSTNTTVDARCVRRELFADYFVMI
ncbi:hypothetical protein FQN54_002679 [Arachnomyces sp. PD_36]|nr:hypothetical protein FQN54_002679 [Arachnomyces sp. PD_36]